MEYIKKWQIGKTKNPNRDLGAVASLALLGMPQVCGMSNTNVTSLPKTLSNIKSDKYRDVSDSTKVSSSNLTEPYIPPLTSPVTEAQAPPESAEPLQPVTAFPAQAISNASSGYAAKTHVPLFGLPVTAPPAEADPGIEEHVNGLVLRPGRTPPEQWTTSRLGTSLSNQFSISWR